MNNSEENKEINNDRSAQKILYKIEITVMADGHKMITTPMADYKLSASEVVGALEMAKFNILNKVTRKSTVSYEDNEIKDIEVQMENTKKAKEELADNTRDKKKKNYDITKTLMENTSIETISDLIKETENLPKKQALTEPPTVPIPKTPKPKYWVIEIASSLKNEHLYFTAEQGDASRTPQLSNARKHFSKEDGEKKLDYLVKKYPERTIWLQEIFE